MLKAYLHPKKKPNDRHWYAYDVVFDGEIIVISSANRTSSDFVQLTLKHGPAPAMLGAASLGFKRGE